MNGIRYKLRIFLLPFSLIYGVVVWFRNVLFDSGIISSVKFKLPVISVGNITVGGTGKTPHVEYLIRLLKEDYKLAVLSRGYRRKTKKFIVASVKSTVHEVGDEPLQMKLKFPEIFVAVDRMRVNGIKELTLTHPEPNIIILDDAFQHRYVTPGLSIVLVDYYRPLFEDLLLPAGNLRESKRNIKRADIIIVTKCPMNLSEDGRNAFLSKLGTDIKQQVFFSAYSYGKPTPVFTGNDLQPLSLEHMRKNNACILLVTGIANPKPFRQFLQKSLPIYDEIIFPDHHSFSQKDIDKIQRQFELIPAKEKYILVSEKDAVRLRESCYANEFPGNYCFYIPVEVVFLGETENAFIKAIEYYLHGAIME